MNRNPEPLERCGQCQALIEEGEALGTHVPDSSYLHPHDPTRDGDRPLIACSPEHLAELMKAAGARPYLDVELWAGKIDRALATCPQGLSLYALAVKTGLTQDQIEQAALWSGRSVHSLGNPP
ncbi:hypothetical protein [Streptomyces sp. NPDC127084]|uniref:hypothetical protein n=1 Tax=Streptomyces sp. NPDC127084 TaxID=3347133 RepID=UPI00364AA3BA